MITYIKDSMGRSRGYLDEQADYIYIHDGSQNNRIVASYHKKRNVTTPMTSADGSGQRNGNQLMMFLKG